MEENRTVFNVTSSGLNVMVAAPNGVLESEYIGDVENGEWQHEFIEEEKLVTTVIANAPYLESKNMSIGDILTSNKWGEDLSNDIEDGLVTIVDSSLDNDFMADDFNISNFFPGLVNVDVISKGIALSCDKRAIFCLSILRHNDKVVALRATHSFEFEENTNQVDDDYSDYEDDTNYYLDDIFSDLDS